MQSLAVALTGFASLTGGTASAVNTIFFSPSAPGVTKSVATWGVDTAWPSYDNVRLSVEHMGAANVDVVRLTFHPGYPLTDNGNGTYSLSATARGFIDQQLNLAALAGSKPLTLVPGEFAPPYNAQHWVQTIKATQEYVNSRPGWTNVPISSVEVFNEPDFWAGQGNAADLNNAIGQLKAYPAFQNTAFPAASTLNANVAQSWYQGAPNATAGSSHLLGGSLTSYVNFMNFVQSQGKPFENPELHSLGEAIVGAEHGMSSGIWWADVLRARGLFVQASDGQRLGYFEDLPRQSAAAVYRGPDGKIRAFAGGVERFGNPTSYRFVSTDQDVYFNGIPVREYMLHTKADENASATDNDFANYGSWSNQGSYADIETSAEAAQPPLDGYRWKIVNASTGQVLEVVGGETGNGALIRSATDAGALHQLWDVVRTRNGYYHLFNANSGRTAEIAGGSLADNAAVRQWGTADNNIQQWYLDDAGGGAYYLRNANSTKYLTGSGRGSFQASLSGSDLQKWQFVLANPASGPKARYRLAGDVYDSAGANHGSAVGGPAYGAGPHGASAGALQFDGVNDYVQLPAGVASSNDMTVSAWVYWNGTGGAWQRIFDFGNNTTSYMFLTPRSGDNTMRFAITTGGNGAEQILDTSPLPAQQWVHLAVTLGGNTGILYVDGVPRVAGQILLDPADVNPTLNYLGKSQWPDALLQGMIVDFRIYDYALAMDQVAALANDADVDGNGTVDGADFLQIQRTNPAHIAAWQAQYGQPALATSAAGAVPEPAAGALLVLASILAGAAVRSRNRQSASLLTDGGSASAAYLQAVAAALTPHPPAASCPRNAPLASSSRVSRRRHDRDPLGRTGESRQLLRSPS
ncbi:MAG: RICIN domain-containing protein [Pirellulales bacterium]|nr:RICIN domain-containing protein [Pirellulales bacterium]